MRIDAYTHFIPENFFNKIVEGGHADIGKRIREIPAFTTLKYGARSSGDSRTMRRSCPIRCRRSKS
jgi:hypothetical protein